MFGKIWKLFLCLALMALSISACQQAGQQIDEPPTIPTSTVTLLPSPTPETTMNEHWSFQTEGPIFGSAMLSEDVIYIGSDDGNLYALDAVGGELAWKFATQGIVRSTPAVDNGLVYFASDDGYLYAINAQDGQKVWSTDIGNFIEREIREDLGNSPAPTGYDYVQSSPVVADGIVYVGSTDGKVYALAADTGAVKWTFETKQKIRATPTVDNGVVYIGGWDTILYALDAQTGETRWVSPMGGQVQSKAAVGDGLVYCASRKASVIAVDINTGAMVWEHSYGNNMWVESSPRLVDDVVYIGSSGSKIVLGLNAQTGEPTAIFVSPDFHWSTPIVIGDNLYIGGASGAADPNAGFFALKIIDGHFSTEMDGRQVFSIPTTMEAHQVWAGVTGSPVSDGSLIYFGALDGKVYAINTIP